MAKVQKYINQKYLKEERKKVIELDISNHNLEGELNLIEFVNLKVLNCSNNKLTTLNVSKCSKLRELYCYNNCLINLDLDDLLNLEEIECSSNLLTDINLPREPKKLVKLNLQDNNLSERNISCFTRFTKLEEL